MRSEGLLDIVLARPFKPFRFTFTTGETYDLMHPEMTQLSDIWRTKCRRRSHYGSAISYVAVAHCEG